MNSAFMRADVAVIVLTRNAGDLWPAWIQGIQQQTVQAGRYLVIDSASSDQTVPLALQAGFEVLHIMPEQFDHGGTRQLAAQLFANAKFLVYMTQDAILQQVDALEQLLNCMQEANVAMAFGRHIPRAEADPIESYTRHFTYPTHSYQRDRSNLAVLGYRAVFASNVFAVYRTSALKQIGGFPRHIILSEDSYVAARFLLAGWKTVYCAESQVEHSHAYSLKQIFKRYFDIGVYHTSEQALLQAISKPDKEASQYVFSLVGYLYKKHKRALPLALIQIAVKGLAFHLGKKYQVLPTIWCQGLSLHKAYWQLSTVMTPTSLPISVR